MHSKKPPCLKNILSILLVFIFVQILTACGNSEDIDKIKEAIEVNELNISSLQLSSRDIIETTETEQFTALAVIGDDSEGSLDVSMTVRWTSSNNEIATINSSGLLTGKADGLVTVTAQYADLSASKDIQLSPAILETIDITDNPSPVSACHAEYQLSANGNYDDGTDRDITASVAWTSGTPALLAIDDEGAFETYGNGSVEVTATRSSISGSAIVIINDDIDSVAITSVSSSVNIGSALAFTATGTFDDTSTADITNMVTWSTDDAAVLSISNDAGSKGIATGLAVDTAIVSATCDVTPTSESSNELSITVTEVPVVNAVAIEEDKAILQFKISDSPEQLTANLKKTDNSYGDDVTEDDNTTWSINSTISGTPVTLGLDGEISFTQTGVTEIKVRYYDDDNEIGPFTDLIEVEITLN